MRIEEGLRERIGRLATALNQTPHSFMVEALAQKADEAEWRLGMQNEAWQRDAALQAGEPSENFTLLTTEGERGARCAGDVRGRRRHPPRRQLDTADQLPAGVEGEGRAVGEHGDVGADRINPRAAQHPPPGGR